MATSNESRGRTPSSPDEQPDRSRQPRWLFGLLLVIVIYGVGLTVVGIRDAWNAVAAASFPALLAAVGFEAITVASLAMVHHSSAAAVDGSLRYTQALNVSMSAFTLSQTVPGGGAVAGLVAVRRLQRFGLEGPNATASVGLTATLALATITGIAGIGVGVAVFDAHLPVIALVAALTLFLVLLGAAVGIVAVLRSRKAEQRILGLLGRVHVRIRERLDEWSSSLAALREDPPTAGALTRIVAWSAVNWTADIAALWLVFAAFDQPVDLSVLLVGFGVAQLGTAIPITPGGVGFVETGMVGAFVAVGQPASMATTIVLTYRVLATWLPSLVGMPALLQPAATRPNAS